MVNSGGVWIEVTKWNIEGSVRKSTESSARLWEKGFEAKVEMAGQFCYQKCSGFKEIVLLWHPRCSVCCGLQMLGCMVVQKTDSWRLGVGIPAVKLGTWESQGNLTFLRQAHFLCFLNKTISNHFPFCPSGISPILLQEIWDIYSFLL